GVTTLSGEQKNSTVRLGSKTVTMPSTRLTFTAGGDGQYTVAVEGWGDANWSDAFGLSGLTITQLGLTGTLTKAPKADGRKSVAGFGLDLQAKLSLSGAAYTATLSADLDGSKLSDLSLSLSGDLSLGFTGITQLSSIKLTNAVVGVRPADAQGYFAGSMSWKGMTGTAAVVMGKGTAAAFLQATELDLGALVNQKKLLASLPKLSGVLMVGKSAAGNKPIRDLPAPVSKMLGDVYGDTSEKVTFAAGVSFFTKVDAASLGFTQANVPGPLVLSGALDLEKSTFDLSASLGAFPAIPNTPQGFAIESPRFLLGVSKADTGFEFDLGLGITMRANVGGQDLAVTTKVRADSTGSLKFTGTLDTDWVAPLGLSSLTLKAPVGVSFSVNADASVDLGFQAGARIDDKEFNPVGLCLNIQAAAPVPVPKKIAVHFKASELTPLTEVQLAASLLKSAANGPLKDGIPDKNFRAALKKIDTQSNQLEHMADGLPMPKLTGAEFYLATPGIKCDLPAFDGMGAQITGSLSFMDHDLGGLDSKLNLTDGLKIKGDIKPFKLLDLVSLTQARIDVLAPMPTAGAALFDAHFYLDGNANVLLASGQIHVTLDKKKASFDLESALADLGSTKMFATSIGDDLLHATDFKLGLRAQTDVEGAMLKKLGDGLKATAAARKAAKQAEQKQHEKDLADTQKAFDKLDADVGKRFRKADSDVKDAEKDVDRAQKKLDDAKADCKKKLGGASFLCDTVDAAKKSVDAYEDTLEAARKVLKGIKESTSYANWAAKKTALATLQAEHDAFTDTMNVWSDLDAAAQKLSSGLASDVFTLRKLTFDGSVASASGTLSLDVVVGQADLYETYTLDLKKAVPLDVSKLAGRIADEFANLTKSKKGSGGGSGGGGSGSGDSGGGSAGSG
ncbi:MAG: hypothetical protein JST92_26650, partial [Deltaproteobacteria bacterium]|nr:hypothetical protein [Deltaproteobacteria bacterium]